MKVESIGTTQVLAAVRAQRRGRLRVVHVHDVLQQEQLHERDRRQDALALRVEGEAPDTGRLGPHRPVRHVVHGEAVGDEERGLRRRSHGTQLGRWGARRRRRRAEEGEQEHENKPLHHVNHSQHTGTILKS